MHHLANSVPSSEGNPRPAHGGLASNPNRHVRRAVRDDPSRPLPTPQECGEQVPRPVPVCHGLDRGSRGQKWHDQTGPVEPTIRGQRRAPDHGSQVYGSSH